jgi:signal transduction histidine kinase
MLTALHKILDIELAIMLETYREDLVARNRTAERLATIGQFAAGIGHELRNPLAVVETSAFLVTRRLEELHVADPGIERHMQKITGEVQRSTRTITDLLELARRRAPKRRTIDALAFVTDAVARAALPAGVKVTVEVAAGLPLDADAEQLERVITNLLVNAGQAMNGVGQVWIEGEREAAATTLRVRDDGPGVPADVGDRVFEALFTTKAKGSGLGLALCRRIVEAHGGTIAVESQLGVGTTFIVSIPFAPVAAEVRS